MREMIHPKAVSIRSIQVTKVVDGKQVQESYEFSFADFVDYVSQAAQWTAGGSNDEVAARLGTLSRFQDEVERTKPGQKMKLDNDDHDAVCRVLREYQMQGVPAAVAAKSRRFVFDVLTAARVEEKKDAAAEPKAKRNGKAAEA